jgi:hypothetical protein
MIFWITVPFQKSGGIFLLVKGSKVIFESIIYEIHWVYDSGYCEIKNDEHIKLVKLSDLTPLE